MKTTTYHSRCDNTGESITTNTTLHPWNEGTPYFTYMPEWIDTNLACPKCGGQMMKQNGVVYTSNPPKYGYQCKKCGHFAYRWE